MNRISRFNHFHRWRNGYYIAYNARSGAVAAMTEEHYRAYQSLSEKISQLNGEAELTDAERELLKQLAHGRFVYPADRAEFDAVKFTHNINRYDLTSLGLTIAPTLACNMACAYCYESEKKNKMKPEVVSSLIDFVKKRADSLQHVDICWYGGEPLLALDVIEEITNELLRLGKEKGFRYSSSMISNGYLLTPEIADKLVQLRVSVVQITIDGPARMHNQKRPLKNGRESFDRIIENIQYAVGKMGVGIRVNVDTSFNSDVIAELLSELKQADLASRVGIYFGQLEASTSVCSSIADTCYATPDFSGVEVEYSRLLMENGFRIDKIPSPTTVFCMAQRVNAFVVDPEGYLYRCYNYVGDIPKSMGNTRDELDFSHPNFKRLFDFNAFENKKCSECDILPICLGGCPAQRADRGLDPEDVCPSWKHNLGPMLEIIARSRQQKLQSSTKEQV